MFRRPEAWLALAASAAVLACSPGGSQSVTAPSVEVVPKDVLPSGPPPAAAPDPCEGPDARARVKCRFDALADAGVETTEELRDGPVGALLTPAQRQSLDAAGARLVREKARFDADRLGSLTRRRASSCRMAECDAALHPACRPGNGDGICDQGEDCLEVAGDGIGDDVQPCHPTKGAGREECVQACDDEAVCREGADHASNRDEDMERHLEGVYEEMTRHVREVNGALKEAGPAVRAIAALPADGDPCALDAGGLERSNDLVAMLAKVAAVASRTGADVAERLCDQTVWGFNCAECCIPVEALAGVLAVANDVLEVVDDQVGSKTLDAALACVAAVNALANENLAELAALQEGLQRVERSQAEIVRLLQTAPGLRPGYPDPLQP